MGWKVLAAFAGAGVAILATHLLSRKLTGTPNGSSSRHPASKRGQEKQGKKQEAGIGERETAVPLAIDSNFGLPTPQLRHQLVALAKKLLRLQAQKEKELRLLFRNMPKDKAVQDARIARSERKAQSFYGKQAEIAIKMATLLCTHSSAKPGNSKKAWKDAYSTVQHARIIAQDILDLETEAERVSARNAVRANTSQLEAGSALHDIQPQQTKLGVELSELVMSEKDAQDARSPKHEEEKVDPSVEQALVGIDNTQSELASALRILEAERKSLLDRMSLAGSLSSHQSISQQIATKQWQQAQIAVKLADLMAPASRSNAQQAEAVGKILGLVAEEAQPSGSGSGCTTSGDSAAVANPIHVQQAALGVQLAGLLDDDSRSNSAKRPPVSGGPPKKTYSCAATHQDWDEDLQRAIDASLMDIEEEQLKSAIQASLVITEEEQLNLAIQESLMDTEEEQLSLAIEASMLDMGGPRASRMRLGGISFASCH